MNDTIRKTQSPFKMKGIYFHDGFSVEPRQHAPLFWKRQQWEREIKWLKACGVNAIEFATMLEFNRIPSTDMEKQKVEDRLDILDLAHEYGMKFGYLLSNTALSTVPEDEEPGDQFGDRAVELCPQEPGNFEKTMAVVRWYMHTYREADFYEEFAADWGGCRCDKCGVPQYMRYVKTIAWELQELNPKAQLYADTWCISYWGDDPNKMSWEEMFNREIAASREVIEALNEMPSNTHLALPCHNLYRALAFSAYGSKKDTPVFPQSSDIDQVKAMGRKVLAWPHFVVDDDAGRSVSWGIVHSEIRYIRHLLQSLRDRGIDDVMCNLYLPYLQISNTYAYGRLLENPDEGIEGIINDFSRLVAHSDDAPMLAEVMAWVENNSYWEEQLPEDARQEHLPCQLTKDKALELAGKIRGNSSPHLPLPIPTEVWLEDLQRSIKRMDWVK